MAAGFGSVRRFNETFQQLFDRPPSALRRSGGADVSAGEGGAATIRLPYRAPYDWEAMLAFLTARAIPGVEVIAKGRYIRTLAVGEAKAAFTAMQGGEHFGKIVLEF